jgi:hypothetical protein
MIMKYTTIWLCLLLSLSTIAIADEPIDFQRQILPILTDHCNHCHGVDAETRQGGLRLDQEKSALAGGDSGEPAIVARDPGASLIMKRITSTDPDVVMPPPKENKPLTAEQSQLLRSWIEQGAKYGSHWAFDAPVKRPVPLGEANPVDAFVLDKLKKNGVQPSAPAAKNTLARRIYLDTIGIPPSPKELSEFLAANVDSTIDSLLASKQYGEKWTRHWLDVARFSDTNGYEKDLRRDQWAWRDWVIDAINQDMPYDQFIVEQIAGDLLPNPTQSQIVATGFLRNSMLNEEGAIVPEQFRMVEMFDRMDCIGKSTMGMTIQCAQCHTHKFDPITHDEYYGMFAFLNNAYEAQSAVYQPEQLKEIESIRSSISAVEQQIRERIPTWESDSTQWATTVSASQPNWQHITFDDLNSVSGLNHPVMQKDNAILMTGHTSSDVYMIGSPEVTGATGLRLEVLNHGDLPFQGPGRSSNGMWQLHTIELLVKKPESKDWEKIKFSSVTADHSTPETKDASGKNVFGPVSGLIDDKPETFWTSDRGIGRRNQPSVAVIALESPLSLPPGSRFKIAMHMGDNIGCCRFSLCTTPNPVAPACDQAAVLAMSKPAAMQSAEDRNAIFTAWRKSKPELKDANATIESSLDRMPQPYTSVMHLVEREESLGRPTHVLDRGEWDRPKTPVQPHVPAAFHTMSAGSEPPRLAFARWLVDRRSPLAARVAVNRVWQAIFGSGLVDTAEDFGTRTLQPAQAELLDYLAVDFMEHGWSQKYLIKLILTSKTYQQNSATRKDLLDRDPKNEWLARGPRFRAEAELVRDIALASSGLLSNKMGGPSVIPPVPQNVLNYNYIVPTYWNPPTGPDRYRRAVYVFRKRSMPDPVMSSFDSPNGDFACARRVRSNTPLAALAGLNETIFVEAAQGMAIRVLREGGDTDESRIDYAYLLCMCRTPSAAERSTLLQLLHQQRQRIADGWLNPREITTGDASKLPGLPEHATPQDAAAWTICSRVLLNLDETISKN